MKGLNENLMIIDEQTSDVPDEVFTFFDVLNVVCLVACFSIVAIYWLGNMDVVDIEAAASFVDTVQK